MKIEYSIESLMRFGISGALFVLLDIIAPMTLLASDILKKINSAHGIILLGVFCLMCGYLLDCLKIHRFNFGYGKAKDVFFMRIALMDGWKRKKQKNGKHEVPFNRTKAYEKAIGSFTKAIQQEKKQSSDIFSLHTKNVMAQKCTAIFYSSIISWPLVAIFSQGQHIKIVLMVIAGCIAIGFRMNYMSWQEQKRIDYLYLDYIERHKDDVFN